MTPFEINIRKKKNPDGTPGNSGAGLFCFLQGILKRFNIAHHKRGSVKAHVELDSLLYKADGSNIWDIFFVNPKVPDDAPTRWYSNTTGATQLINSNRRMYSDTLNKYFIKNSIFSGRLKDEVRQLGIDNRTLGLHYRGTDKYKEYYGRKHIDYDLFLSGVKSQLGNYNKIFLATDEVDFVEYIEKANLGVPIIKQDIKRIRRGTDIAIHKSKNFTEDEKLWGAMLDCYLLAECGSIVHTRSNLSCFSLLINPNTANIHVTWNKVNIL